MATFHYVRHRVIVPDWDAPMLQNQQG